MKHLVFLVFLMPLALFGQTNESDSLKTEAGLSVTGMFQGGNVQTVIFRTKTELSFTTFNNWVLKTVNSYVYQAFGGVKADQDLLSLNFLYFQPQKRIYPQLIGIATTNFRREIALRYLVGTGITFQVLEQKDAWLKISLSSEYEETEFRRSQFNLEEYNGSNDINTFRATLWVNGKYKLYDKRITLSHESYIQPSLNKSNNYRWQADLGLELMLTKRFNFKINYLSTYESIVIEGQKQNDRLLTFGLSVKSY
ncbi:MAG: DUF481 domain-containing protein [Bacteroidia bacterium]